MKKQYTEYKKSVTIKKGVIVTIIVGALAAAANQISVDVSEFVSDFGISVSPEKVYGGIVACATGILEAAKNWKRNHKLGKE